MKLIYDTTSSIDNKKLHEEIKSLKIEITSLKKSIGEYEQENHTLKIKISLHEKEKINY